MIVNVNVITEKSYSIKIDVPEGDEDKIYEELSCEPYMEDITDIESFLKGKGLRYDTTEEDEISRIETWR